MARQYELLGRQMINVIPVEEFELHTLDTTCECGPTVDFSLPQILITHEQLTDCQTLWGVYPDG